MMWWPWGRKTTKTSEARDDRLAQAERQAQDLEQRADRAARRLEARLRRNHWGETVAEIARREL